MYKKVYPLTVAGIFLAILLVSISPVSDSDLWWHLASGKYIVESGNIPRADIFSHTVQGKEWLDHEWLSQVVFYEMYDLWGFWGVVMVKSSAVLIAFFFLYRRTSISNGKAATVITLLAVVLVSHDAWLARPMIFSFMFLSIFLFVLERGKYLWSLPLLTILWANLHGGFILGLLILFLYAAGSTLAGDPRGARGLAIIFAASALASLFNPNTYRLLIYPFQYAFNTTHAMFISEWQSPVFHTFSAYEALILLTIVALALKKGLGATEVILLAVFTHLSLFAVRNVSLYGLVCAPIIIGHLESGIKDLQAIYTPAVRLVDRFGPAFEKSFIPGFVYTGIVLSFALFLSPYLSGAHTLDAGPAPIYPEGAVDYLIENKPPGNLYNRYGWGGYCIWTLYPEYRVFIDGRADLYGDFIYDYLKVHRAQEGWNDTLDEYKVSVVLTGKGDQVDVLLKASPEWELAYQDDIAVVYLPKR
jgi:hypothetical protein